MVLTAPVRAANQPSAKEQEMHWVRMKQRALAAAAAAAAACIALRASAAVGADGSFALPMTCWTAWLFLPSAGLPRLLLSPARPPG
jgi:hypothetical protein